VRWSNKSFTPGEFNLPLGVTLTPMGEDPVIAPPTLYSHFYSSKV
jgi:hypothetical protein